jgi:hypothetical protein
MFLSRLLTVDNTPMMQKIPMVTPNNDKKVLILFLPSSWMASLSVVRSISSVFLILVLTFYSESQRKDK